RQFESRGGLLLQAHVDRNQSLALQLGGNLAISLGGKCPGADLPIRRHRPKKVRRRHKGYNSCVTRITSSAEVMPRRTLFHPSSRRFCMPWRRGVSRALPEAL